MLPKKSFAVRITDERLLSPKRGTVKRSANGHNYSLMKKENLIIIQLAVPLPYKDAGMAFAEGKVDLSTGENGLYIVTVEVKKLIKLFYVLFLLIVPLALISFFNTGGRPLGLLFACTVLPFSLWYQHRNNVKGVRDFAERIEQDKDIFLI